mgnify:CR=1 FL=1
MKRKLFVYGTLKRGGRLHDFYLKDQEFLGTYYTEPNYFLYDSGAFPMAFRLPKGTGQSIKGEIYRTDKNNFDMIATMEEGAGYNQYKDTFLSEPGSLDNNAIIFIYPSAYLSKKIKVKQDIVSWAV